MQATMGGLKSTRRRRLHLANEHPLLVKLRQLIFLRMWLFIVATLATIITELYAWKPLFPRSSPSHLGEREADTRRLCTQNNHNG
jgi:hypothetical protein